MHVLVVDDSRTLRMLLIRELNAIGIVKITEVYGEFKYWFKESGIDAKCPAQKEFKTYFEKKFGPHGSHSQKNAGWKGIAIIPREIDLETPADFEPTTEKEL